MADVRLDFDDLDADELPDVCMRCGEPSTVRPTKSFSWMPTWARFVPPIVGIWFIKRRRVPIPLCDQHKHHWTLRYAVAIGGVVVLLGLLAAGLILLALSEGRPPNRIMEFLAILMLTFDGLLFVAWLITIIVLLVSMIGAVEITDDTIILKNVHADFRRAYREMTRGHITPDLDEIVREKWQQSSNRKRREPEAPRRSRRDDSPSNDKYRRG
jgi:hypothetical protein